MSKSPTESSGLLPGAVAPAAPVPPLQTTGILFPALLGGVHVVLVFFFLFYTDIVLPTTKAGLTDNLQRYNYLVGVTLMMFVGFGCTS
jgi:hypothetical protein